MKTFTKDPEAILDYVWDWSDWLQDDTIQTATVTPPTGITVVGQPSILDGVVTAFLEGGEVGKAYVVTCNIETAGNRTDERSIRLIIEQR